MTTTFTPTEAYLSASLERRTRFARAATCVLWISNDLDMIEIARDTLCMIARHDPAAIIQRQAKQTLHAFTVNPARRHEAYGGGEIIDGAPNPFADAPTVVIPEEPPRFQVLAFCALSLGLWGAIGILCFA